MFRAHTFLLLCGLVAAASLSVDVVHGKLTKAQEEQLLEEKYDELNKLLERSTPYDGIMDDLERLHEEIEAIRPGANDIVPVRDYKDMLGAETFLEAKALEDPKPELNSQQQSELNNEASAASAVDKENAAEKKMAAGHKSVGFGIKDAKFVQMVIPKAVCSKFPVPVQAYGLVAYELLPKHFKAGATITVPTLKSGCKWRIVNRYDVRKGVTDAQAALFVNDDEKKLVLVNRATYGVKDWLTNIKIWRVKCDYKYKNNKFDGDALISLSDAQLARSRYLKKAWNKTKAFAKKTVKKVKKVYKKVKAKVKHVVKTVKQVFGPNGRCGKIHAGFKAYWRAVRTQIMADIESGGYVDKGYEVIVAGHSLGGGVGTIAALEIKERYGAKVRMGVYTWGAPAVGNKAFAAFYNKILGSVTTRYRMKWSRAKCGSRRAASGTDLVSKLPPKWLGYHHVGQEKTERCPFSCDKPCCKTPSTLTGCHSGYGEFYYNWVRGNPVNYNRFVTTPEAPTTGPDGENVQTDTADNPALVSPAPLPPITKEDEKPQSDGEKQAEEEQMQAAVDGVDASSSQQSTTTTTTADTSSTDTQSVSDMDAELKDLQKDVSSRLADRRAQLGLDGIDGVKAEATPTPDTSIGDYEAKRRQELLDRLQNAQKVITDHGGSITPTDVSPFDNHGQQTEETSVSTTNACDTAALTKCVAHFQPNSTPFTFDFSGSGLLEPDTEGSCCYASSAAQCIKKLSTVKELLNTIPTKK
eukprot:TRINITY_DN3575_c0_g1_i1.p1 TRINITY_DN3575_c0_g1~~TRINITY_DN3575_c0_g1_i1.p1  ORF type:complete len:752 (-),score=252.62 TRINITY_DN3575_c0_g1_i1:9-2264(-)